MYLVNLLNLKTTFMNFSYVKSGYITHLHIKHVQSTVLLNCIQIHLYMRGHAWYNTVAIYLLIAKPSGITCQCS